MHLSTKIDATDRDYPAPRLRWHSLGRRADALLWLQFAYQQRDPGLVYLAAEPVFDSVRDDPSFRDLIRRVGVVH